MFAGVRNISLGRFYIRFCFFSHNFDDQKKMLFGLKVVSL